MNKPRESYRYFTTLMGGASVIAIVLSSTAIHAQETASLALEEITVTSSRIAKSGFEAPTPITTLGVEDIEARGATDIASVINEMPGFSGTATPTATASSSRGNGVNALDLRGLGSNRNLVLVNGRRHVPTNEFGQVDLNVIPSLAIQRIEVVTGGASAAWGSDAISGVVNIIYDTKLEGLKTEAQFGMSDEGDAENYRLSLAYGSRIADDRGHFLIAADYNDNKGIPFASARKWSQRYPGFLRNLADTGPNDGIPSFRIADNARLYRGTPNGVTLPGGPLGNIEFLPNGSVIPRELGILGGTMMEGGSGSTLSDAGALVVPIQRKNLLAAFDYALTDSINFYFEGSAAKSDTESAFVNSFIFGSPIYSGNPFLPQNIQQIMTDEGIASFGLFRTNDEFGAITSVSETNNIRLVGGFNGEFGNGWTWDAYYQYGHVSYSNNQRNNLIPANMARAMDAVTDPISGDIVCRSGAAGCVPINLFGAGSPSQAAIDYVTGTSMSDTTLKQTVAAASVSGDLFEGWAGPISSAFGVEYRKDSLARTVDPVSSQSGFLTVNSQPLDGAYNVKEAFAEILVPLLKDSSIGQSMDLNGAIRYTDYSTSGSVVTWKAGLTYEPVNDVRFRGTISRDIRAPAIGEVFLKTHMTFGNFNNPFTNTSDFAQVRTTGNSDLQEERALTKTMGIVLSPRWVDNLQFSLDWYDIKITDAIEQISTQSIVERCGSGEAGFCDLIEFAGDGSIVGVTNKLLNLGTYRLKGLDFEARYALPVGDTGTLGFNLYGTYIYAKNISPDGSSPINYAGEVGPAEDFGMPKWKMRGSVRYDSGVFGLYSQVRYVGSGKYNNSFGPEQFSDEDNNVGSEIYVDLSARYQLSVGAERTVELFGGVNNVFDNDPPALPSDFIAPAATNAVHYDVMGRFLYAGIRAKF